MLQCSETFHTWRYFSRIIYLDSYIKSSWIFQQKWTSILIKRLFSMKRGAKTKNFTNRAKTKYIFYCLFTWRRWCNGQHGCLPSSRSGFNSRPTQFLSGYILLDDNRSTRRMICAEILENFHIFNVTFL